MPVTILEYLRFGMFTLIGMLINVGVASLVVNVIGAPANLSQNLWVNLGALAGVFSAFIWNFLSYRNVVFKAKNSETV